MTWWWHSFNIMQLTWTQAPHLNPSSLQPPMIGCSQDKMEQRCRPLHCTVCLAWFALRRGFFYARNSEGRRDVNGESCSIRAKPKHWRKWNPRQVIDQSMSNCQYVIIAKLPLSENDVIGWKRVCIFCSSDSSAKKLLPLLHNLNLNHNKNYATEVVFVNTLTKLQLRTSSFSDKSFPRPAN